MPTAKFPEMPFLFDPVCGKSPDAMDGYLGLELEADETMADLIWVHEETLDKSTGMFVCDTCYIKIGEPRSENGWIATRENLTKLGINFS